MKFVKSYSKETLILNTVISIAGILLIIFFKNQALYMFALHYLCIAAALVMLMQPKNWRRLPTPEGEKASSICLVFIKIATLQILTFIMIATLPSVGQLLPVPPSTDNINLYHSFIQFNIISGVMPWAAVACMSTLWAQRVFIEKKWHLSGTVLEENGIPASLAYANASIFEANINGTPNILIRISLVAAMAICLTLLAIKLPLGTTFPVILTALASQLLLERTKLFSNIFNKIRTRYSFFTAKVLGASIALAILLIIASIFAAINYSYGEPIGLAAGSITQNIEDFISNIIKNINILSSNNSWLLINLLVSSSCMTMFSLYVASLAKGQRIANIILSCLILPILLSLSTYYSPSLWLSYLNSNHPLLHNFALIISSLLILYQLTGSKRKTSMLANTVLYPNEQVRLKSSSRLLYKQNKGLLWMNIIYLYGSIAAVMWTTIISSISNIVSYPVISLAAIRQKNKKIKK